MSDLITVYHGDNGKNQCIETQIRADGWYWDGYSYQTATLFVWGRKPFLRKRRIKKVGQFTRVVEILREQSP